MDSSLQEEKNCYLECFKHEISIVESSVVGQSALLSACFEWNQQCNAQGSQGENNCNILHTSWSKRRMEQMKEEWEREGADAFLSFTTHSCVFIKAFATEGTSLKDAVIIFNDSYFLEETSKNFASASINLCMVETSIKSLEKRGASDSKFQEISKKFEDVKKMFRAIRPRLGNEVVPAFSGEEILRWMSGAKLNDLDAKLLDEDVDHAILSVKEFISKIFRFSEDDIISSFRMYQTEDEKLSDMCHAKDCQKSKSEKHCRTLNFLCIDPSVVLKKVLSFKPKSIIFTGETLYPFSVFKEELNIPQARIIESQYSVKDYQLFSAIVTCGAGGYFLNSSRECRSDPDYSISVGNSILEILKITPRGEGMIVYFSSYDVLNQSIERWKETHFKDYTLWDLINQQKDTFEVPEDDKDYNRMLVSLRASQKSKGSCLFTVLRGRITEDLQIDINTRRVIVIVGVPFIPSNDPKVELKVAFNHERRKWSGQEFSNREAYKAVRRVLDRQIRSESDYGVALLCDVRYNNFLLSPWIRDKIEKEKRFMEVLEKLIDFFDCTPNRIFPGGPSEVDPNSFGNVNGWEGKKLRKFISKIESDNSYLETMIDRYKKMLEDLNNDIDAEKMKLDKIRSNPVPSIKTQHVDSDPPLQSFTSPRKRPFPEDLKEK